MAASNSYFTNEIIITAMDRFVWFVLLVVLSHLVTEFTRVTGYTRTNNRAGNEANTLNYAGVTVAQQALNSSQLILGKQVQSLVFFPANEYGGSGYYPAAPPPPSLYQQQQQLQQFPGQQQQQSMTSGDLVLPPAPAASGSNAQTVTTAANTGGFSLRPLIDSIFEIPISTLRAVNNLVARLTGSYQHQSPTSASSAGLVAGKAATVTRVGANSGGLLAALGAAQSSEEDRATSKPSAPKSPSSLLRELNA